MVSERCKAIAAVGVAISSAIVVLIKIESAQWSFAGVSLMLTAISAYAAWRIAKSHTDPSRSREKTPMKDEHSTWFGFMCYVMSIFGKSWCIFVALSMFFGATFLPSCNLGGIVNPTIIQVLPLSILAMLTGMFAMAGSFGTPVSLKYEVPDFVLTAILGLTILVGGSKAGAGSTELQNFSYYLLGILVVADILIDWIGRLVHWNYLRKLKTAAGGPSAL